MAYEHVGDVTIPTQKFSPGRLANQIEEFKSNLIILVCSFEEDFLKFSKSATHCHHVFFYCLQIKSGMFVDDLTIIIHAKSHLTLTYTFTKDWSFCQSKTKYCPWQQCFFYHTRTLNRPFVFYSPYFIMYEGLRED